MSDLIAGKFYKVNHTRKGKFVIKFESENSDWVNGQLVDGGPSYVMAHNQVEIGEKITLRKSFCTFEIIEQKQ